MAEIGSAALAATADMLADMLRWCIFQRQTLSAFPRGPSFLTDLCGRGPSYVGYAAAPYVRYV